MWEIVDAHLVDHVNKRLGVISGEIFEHLELVTIGENGLDQIDAFMCRNGGADQLFPCRRVPKFGNTVKPANERWSE